MKDGMPEFLLVLFGKGFDELIHSEELGSICVFLLEAFAHERNA
jgi:hypothetical protein